MSIVAKYAATCSMCHGAIRPGDKIEWAKGQPVRHTICPTGAKPGPVAPRKRVEPRQPQPGEIAVSRRSAGRHDCYEPGAIVHATRIAGGGGPDGHWFAVVCQTGRWQDDDTDEWMIGGILRPATDAECAPGVARAGAKALREQLARDLGAIRGERVSGAMPAGAIVLIPRDGAKLCVTGERVALVDGAILHERVGDPDMMDSWHHYVVRIADADPALVERVASYIAGSK
jgi:hypothetical protein